MKLKHIQEIFKNISQKLPIDLKTSEVFRQELPFIFKSYSIFFQYELKQIHVFLEKKGFNQGYLLEDECFKKLGMGELSFEDLCQLFKNRAEDFVRSTKICTAVWSAFWIEKGEYHHFPLKVELEQLWLRILTQVFFEIDIKQPTVLKEPLLSVFEYENQIIRQDSFLALPSLFQKWKYLLLSKKFKKYFKQDVFRQEKLMKTKEMKWLSILELQSTKPVEQSLLFLWFLVKELTHLSVRLIETQQSKFHQIKVELQQTMHHDQIGQATTNHLDHQNNHLAPTMIKALEEVLIKDAYRTYLLLHTQSNQEKLCIFPSLLTPIDVQSLGILEGYFYMKDQKLDTSHPVVLLLGTFFSVLFNRVFPLPKEIDEINHQVEDPSYQLFLHPGEMHIPSDHVKQR